jgi:hypothetical protein
MALSDLQKMVAGMFSQPQPAANASIYDLARADAQRQSMSALGAGLIGAAVPQTPIMRAQALQSAFAGAGNMGTNVYNAAQARLMAQRAETEAAQQAAQSRFFNQGGVAGAPVSVQDGGFAAGIAPVSMPGATQFPGGLSAQEWNAVTSVGNVNPEAGTSFFTSLVEQKAKAGSGSEAETYGTVMYVTDKASGLPQAVLPKKGGGYVPIAAPGQAIDPGAAAFLKAQGAELGQAGAKAVTGAPEAIAQAELNLQNINALLEPGVIESAVGPYVGTLRPDDMFGMAKNIFSEGEFGSNVALIDQIDFGSFAEGIKLFEGKGALSDAEGKVAKGIKARLTRTQSPEKFTEALNQFKAIVEAGKQRSELLLQTNPATGKPYTAAEAKQAVPPLDEMLNSDGGTSVKQPNASSGGIAVIQSEAEYNALPSGTVFRAPDGSVRTKP